MPAQAPLSATPKDSNVIYVNKPASDSEKLDVYVPEKANGRCLIYAHGGGFKLGDKAGAGPDTNSALAALAHGYVVVSVNYRLSGEALAPAQIVDVKAAIRWVKANADKYGINPDKIALMGVSAGGNLVSLAGTTGNSDVFNKDLTALGAAEGDDKVAAVIDLFGIINFSTWHAPIRLAVRRCERRL
jgi:acetyl esterase/lipase